MKILKLLFLLFVMLTIMPSKSYAVPDSPPPVIMIPGGNSEERPDKGHRSSSIEAICVIDFSSMGISFSEPYAVIAYELWDEDGEYVIASYSDDYEMVMYLTSLSGTYQLRLTTEGGTYIGYLYL